MPDPQNPARELYELLYMWSETPAGETVLADRAESNDWWTPHKRAIALLDAVERRIKELSEEGVRFLGAVERLRFGIFCCDERMDTATNNARRHFAESDLMALELISLMWSEAVLIDVEALGEILRAARDAEDIILGASDLDITARNYLLAIVTGLQQAASSISVNGIAEIHKLADQLSGALARDFAGREDEEKAKGVILRLADAGKKLFYGAVGAGLNQLASGGVQAMLPPGL